MNRWSALALLLAVAGALALRCPRLEVRPMHNDEAVNAIRVRDLWIGGGQSGDPREFHGPSLAYATLPFLWLGTARDFGQLNESTLRLVPVAFGTGLILLLLLFADGLGWQALAWAAALTAASPAMVFYSRYFIHEMLLVFFSGMTLASAWRYFREPRACWAVMAGAGLGLMQATKETCVIVVSAMALAAVATVLWGRGRANRFRRLASFWNWNHVALAAVAAAVVSLLLFSSFLANPGGLLDSLRAYSFWWQRAVGSPAHVHPWYFYLERLALFHRAKGPFWSEGFILALASVGAGVALFGDKTALARFLAFYTMILTCFFSLISYKTPWCLLGFLHGMILLAGIGAAALVQFCRRRGSKTAMIVLLAAGVLHLTRQAWLASDRYSTDPGNPYVYAQTVPELLALVQWTEAIARVHPLGNEMTVKVVAPESDYWPLPWYLRRFRHVGWWDHLPADPYASVVIVSTKLNAALDEKSDRAYLLAGLFEVRPGNFMELYVESELWRKCVGTLPPRED